MLRSCKELQGYAIEATDGDIGRVAGFLFDDQQWVIRYLVVNTGPWLLGREVLVSPIALGHAKWSEQRLPVHLTREQVKSCPPIESNRPVSRQYERAFHDHYAWAYYWGGPGLWGLGTDPRALASWTGETDQQAEPEGDHHLRYTREVLGYHIRATDDAIGHVEDLIIDDNTWAIRYMVVDTRNWLPGKEVLISPKWVREVSWSKSVVHVDLSREAIENSPEFDPSSPVNREYEERLYDYYGRPTYWT